MKLDFLELLGSATGNRAAQLKVAGGLEKVQGLIAGKAENIGTLLGKKFGAPIFEALAKGAGGGATQAVDETTKEATGYTLSGIKQAAGYGGAVLLAVGALLAYLIFRKR